MAEAYLTTDIIVIIVLVVVLGSLPRSFLVASAQFVFYSPRRCLCLSHPFLLDEDRRVGNLEHRPMEFRAQFTLQYSASYQPAQYK